MKSKASELKSQEASVEICSAFFLRSQEGKSKPLYMIRVVIQTLPRQVYVYIVNSNLKAD